jgi:hypothetical protein
LEDLLQVGHQAHIQIGDEPEDEIKSRDSDKRTDVTRLLGGSVGYSGFSAHLKKSPLYPQICPVRQDIRLAGESGREFPRSTIECLVSHNTIREDSLLEGEDSCCL